MEYSTSSPPTNQQYLECLNTAVANSQNPTCKAIFEDVQYGECVDAAFAAGGPCIDKLTDPNPDPTDTEYRGCLDTAVANSQNPACKAIFQAEIDDLPSGP